jgi:deoxyribodipyrimidine photolyase-related protein
MEKNIHIIFYDQLFGVLKNCTPILITDCWIEGQHEGKVAFNRECCKEFAKKYKIKNVFRKIEDVKIENFGNVKKTVVKLFEPADLPVLERVREWGKKYWMEILPNPGFMVKNVGYVGKRERLWFRFGDFYKMFRMQTGILMKAGKPIGGKFSFDEVNREKIRDEKILPKDNFNVPFHRLLPRTRVGAKLWLKKFLNERLKYFGIYQDAIMKGEVLLFHSGISALLNVGLLRPKEIVDKIIKCSVPLQSKEAFIRQLVWREFMHSLYRKFGKDKLLNLNFFSARKDVPDEWYNKNIKVDSPLTDCISRAHHHAYLHHIERLMVVGNTMNLMGIHPVAVFDWFIKIVAIDSYEWVMVGNILMTQFNDGGKFVARKPYISTHNYILKMSNWKESEMDEKWKEKMKTEYKKKITFLRKKGIYVGW